MGYKSTVGIKCEQKAYDMFKKAWESENFTPDKILSNGDEHIIVWDRVKWYDDADFTDVDAICKVMDELDDHVGTSDDGYGYKFIRLGESCGDEEERDNGYDVDFYWYRELDTDGFKPVKEEHQ